MRTEYKRDMNHNYLIVYGENEINTDSYQVRMLAGNVIPSLLKCRIQGMDGRFLIYFDITSKQAVNVLYEEKKMGVEDLRLIFGGFVKAMEDAAEYLINPGQFIMSPEYIYTDIEKRQIYFCMMPGYEKDIKEQFQLLTEYILPKIDHQDQDAVILGYGVYKRAMEDSFHLEHIKEELYKTQSSDVNGEKKEKINAKKTEQEMEFAEEETFPEDNENRNEFVREGEDSKEPGRLNPVGAGCCSDLWTGSCYPEGISATCGNGNHTWCNCYSYSGYHAGPAYYKDKKSFASPGTGVCIRRNSETHRKNKKYAIME